MEKERKKLQLNQGLQKYESSVDTYIIPPLQNVKPGCKNCRKNCQVKFTEQERLDLNKNFWKLKNITAKRPIITKYVTLTPKQKNRKRDSTKTGKRKGSSLQVSSPKQWELIDVCQTFFTHFEYSQKDDKYSTFKGYSNEVNDPRFERKESTT